jgi:hypothetical protein
MWRLSSSSVLFASKSNMTFATPDQFPARLDNFATPDQFQYSNSRTSCSEEMRKKRSSGEKENVTNYSVFHATISFLRSLLKYLPLGPSDLFT